MPVMAASADRVVAADPGSRATEATPWFAPAWQMLPLGKRRCLVRNPLNGAAIELSSGEYAVLSTCQGCQPLAEHELRAARELSAPLEHRPAFREVIERCARQGLLMALPDLVARFGPAQPVASPPPPIVVRTADRPQLLLRLLQGAATVQARTGCAYHWHVVDDSRHETSRQANRDAIARCHGLDVLHHDLAGQPSLEAELIQALPGLEAEIRLLLAAPEEGEATYGRPINYALLRFAGRRLFLVDDDVTIDPRRPALSSHGVEVSLAPEIAFWYESTEAALRDCPALEIDPFADHARWLGLPLAQAWRNAKELPGGLRVGDLPVHCGASFASDARVLFTRNQVLGDPGWDKFASSMLMLAPETRRWLAAQPDAARYALESQVHWRGRAALRIAPHQTLSTTTLTGVDNSVLMPPTERSGRDVDLLLGEVARCVHPSAWHVELPFALPHLRQARRAWLRPEQKLILPPSLLLVTRARALSPALRAEGAAERMHALAAGLLDLAAAGEARLRDLLEEQAIEHASRILFSIQEQLGDASLPAAWHATLQAWQRSPALGLDRESLRSCVVAPEVARAKVQGYARRLAAWPRIWNYCRERFA